MNFIILRDFAKTFRVSFIGKSLRCNMFHTIKSNLPLNAFFICELFLAKILGKLGCNLNVNLQISCMSLPKLENLYSVSGLCIQARNVVRSMNQTEMLHHNDMLRMSRSFSALQIKANEYPNNER